MHDSSNMIDKILTFIQVNHRKVIYKNDLKLKMINSIRLDYEYIQK